MQVENEKTTPAVSYSMRSMFGSCQRKVYLRWCVGIRRSYEDNPARAIGRGFHNGLQALRNKLDVKMPMEMLKDDLKAMGHYTPDAVSRVEAYLAGYHKLWPTHDLTWHSEEKLAWRGEIGFVDAFYETGDGIWIVEDKTAAGFKKDVAMEAAALQLNEQLMTYVTMLQDVGYVVQGVRYRQTKKSKAGRTKHESDQDFKLRMLNVYTTDEDRYREHIVRFNHDELMAFRENKTAQTTTLQQKLEHQAGNETRWPKNGNNCMGMYGPCDYLEICSSKCTATEGMYERTGLPALGGDTLRENLNIKERDNEPTKPTVNGSGGGTDTHEAERLPRPPV